jgi:voltage-gated potassium channel Kch
MAQLKSKLKNHTIICGFGVKGQAIADELLSHQHSREQIVVIEPEEAAVQHAASQGFVALKGDASSEQMLRAANIEDADHILVAPHRDDECVLICLTARQLNEKVRIIASVREEENIKLLYRAGADVVVAPSVAGGRMMSAAVRQKAVVPFLQDLLVFGQGLDTVECGVLPDEIGQCPCNLERLQKPSSWVCSVVKKFFASTNCTIYACRKTMSSCIWSQKTLETHIDCRVNRAINLNSTSEIDFACIKYGHWFYFRGDVVVSSAENPR